MLGIVYDCVVVYGFWMLLVFWVRWSYSQSLCENPAKQPCQFGHQKKRRSLFRYIFCFYWTLGVMRPATLGLSGSRTKFLPRKVVETLTLQHPWEFQLLCMSFFVERVETVDDVWLGKTPFFPPAGGSTGPGPCRLKWPQWLVEWMVIPECPGVLIRFDSHGQLWSGSFSSFFSSGGLNLPSTEVTYTN